MSTHAYRAAAMTVSALVLLSIALFDSSQAQAPDDRVVLITLDGARTEEMFGGLDLEILKSTLKDGATLESDPTYKRFWASDAKERRRKLMPFFWGTLMAHHGSIAGNRALGSSVRLTNRHWFSYPGYSEILLGEAHDDDDQEQRSGAEPLSDRARGLREQLEPPARARRNVRILGRLQPDRRAHRRRDHGQCRTGRSVDRPMPPGRS